MRSLIHASVLGAFTAACGGYEAQFSEGNDVRIRPLTPTEQADLKATYVREFSAGTIENKEILIDTEFGLVSQNLTLYQKPKSIETKQQINRQPFVVKFTQGHDGSFNTDRFPVVEAGLLDILIVMDNSGTMKSMQDQLAVSMPQLLKHIQNTNWQIAVVTTDSACLRKTATGKKTVTKADYDSNRQQAELDYSQLISVGISGEPKELGIKYATEGLIGDCGDSNADWKREDSNKVVFIVTDEKNCGSASNEGCTQPNEAQYASADYFLNKMPENTRVYGLFFLEPDYNANCPDSGGYENQYPTEYIRLVNETGGIYGEICQKDYTQILEAVSADVGERIVQKFPLSYMPEEITEVKVDDLVLAASDYELDAQSLVLKKKVDLSAKVIEVTYKHGSVERRQNFPLGEDPAIDSLQVIINGKQLESDAYVYDAAKKEVTIISMPADKAKIEIKFRKNQVLPASFAIDGNVVPETLEVYLDGQLTQDFSWNPGSRTITFGTAPRDGVEVKSVYSQPGDKQTIYNVAGVDIDRLENFYVEDIQTHEVLNVIRNGNQLVFVEDDVAPGREVVVRYNLIFPEEALKFAVEIAERPLNNNVEVMGDSDAEVCTNDLNVSEGSVSFTCAHDNVFLISVRYNYVVDYTNRFEMPGNYNDRKKWQVLVNDVPFTEYTREGNTVIIPEESLPPGAKVKIILTPDPDDVLVKKVSLPSQT